MYKSLRQQTLHYFARPHSGVRRTPLQSAAAWRGDTLRATGDWIQQLDGAEVDELLSAVRHARDCGRPMARLRASDFPLPRLAPRIAGWRELIRHGRGFVLVRGFPVEQWSESDASLCFWALGLHLGIPGAQNPEGDLLGHVRDQQTTADVRLYRTSKHIDVHCDAADVVGLMCLARAKSGGLSRIVSSVTVYNTLLAEAPELVDRLYRPLWFDTKGEGGIAAFPIAPCAHADDELRTFWQSDYYRSAERIPHVPPLRDDERRLLDLYDEIAAREPLYLDMDLQPGDVQLLSNHTILHARTAYEDHPEPGRRRHLLRLWISLPERRSLRIRWLTTRSWGGLAAAALREYLRPRRAA